MVFNKTKYTIALLTRDVRDGFFKFGSVSRKTAGSVRF